MPASVRISPDTHQTVSALARATRRPMGEVIDLAVERYRRDVLLDAADEAYAAADARGDRDTDEVLWEMTVADGLPDER